MISASVVAGLGLLLLTAPVSERVKAPRASGAVAFSSRDTGAVRLDFTTLVPRAKSDIVALSHSEPGSPWRVHRILMDGARGLYHGYDIEVSRGASSGTFAVALKPLAAAVAKAFEQSEWQDYCRGCAAPRPVSARAQQFPGPQTVAVGQRLEIDLLADETTGERITEQIGISAPRRRPEGVRVREPEDLTLENLLFQMGDSKLLVNGKAVSEHGGGSVSSDIVWTAVPGRGRVFFSLVPRAGYDFTKTAVVAGDRLSFAIDGDAYEWVSAGAILTAGPVPPFNDVQRWNVWMLRDPGFAPAGVADGLVGAGFDERAVNRLKRP